MFRFKQAYSQIRAQNRPQSTLHNLTALSHTHTNRLRFSPLVLILILVMWRIWWLLIMSANGRWDLTLWRRNYFY